MSKKCKCLHPVESWICGTRLCKDGVLSPNIVFSPTAALKYYLDKFGSLPIAKAAMDEHFIPQPCGKCAACQIRKRKDYSIRLAHESMCHENACFITLTYDDKNVPVTDWNELDTKRKQFDRGVGELPEMTLLPADVQKFIKRLRRHLEYVPTKKNAPKRDHIDHIRYFAVGEYGSKTRRPHYHIIIFGWFPSDKHLFFLRDGHNVYRSAQIEKLWKYGFSSFTEVCPQTAKYCARYVTKKFARLNEDDGSSISIVPEFTLQSVRNGGIGSPWLELYAQNLRTGFVNVRQNDRIISRCSIPRYYFDRLRKINLPLWLELRDERIRFVKSHPDKYDEDAYNALLRSVQCQRLKDDYLATFEFC